MAFCKFRLTLSHRLFKNDETIKRGFNGSLDEFKDATSAFAHIQLSMPKPNGHGATEIRTRTAHAQFISQNVGDVKNVSAGFERMIKTLHVLLHGLHSCRIDRFGNGVID